MLSLVMAIALTTPGQCGLFGGSNSGGLFSGRLFGGRTSSGYSEGYAGSGCSGSASYGGCNGSSANYSYASQSPAGKWVWHPAETPMNATPVIEEIEAKPKKVNAAPGKPATLVIDAPDDAVITVGKEKAVKSKDGRFVYVTQPLTDDFDWRCSITTTVTRNGKEEVERNAVMVLPGERKSLAVMTALKKSNGKNLAAK